MGMLQPSIHSILECRVLTHISLARDIDVGVEFTLGI